MWSVLKGKYEFDSKLKNQFILLYSLFLLLFMGYVIFSTIYEFNVLFQLTFTFIYNTFTKKISVSAK